MSARSEAKKEFEKRIADISRYDFVQRYVHSSLPERRETPIHPDDFEVSTVQNDGTGPATLEFRFRPSTRLFAKLYRDESGAHAYRVLRSLYDDGFGRDHRYGVAEPLSFVAADNILITRAAEGTSLDSYLSLDRNVALKGVREAARWLAKLHSSPIRVGKVDDPWYMFSKLSSRISKVAVAHPQELKNLTPMFAMLEKLEGGLVREDPVQTHGQFRPIHVFLTDEKVTLVDLDRSRPSDPAKDLAEFIHRLRSEIFHRSYGMDYADRLTEAFLSEYSERRPSGLNLAFYHCFHILVSKCRKMTGMTTNDPSWERKNSFYSSEFDKALSSHNDGKKP